MRLGKSGASGVKKAIGVEYFEFVRLHESNEQTSIVKGNNDRFFVILHLMPDALIL